MFRNLFGHRNQAPAVDPNDNAFEQRYRELRSSGMGHGPARMQAYEQAFGIPLANVVPAYEIANLQEQERVRLLRTPQQAMREANQVIREREQFYREMSRIEDENRRRIQEENRLVMEENARMAAEERAFEQAQAEQEAQAAQSIQQQIPQEISQQQMAQLQLAQQQAAQRQQQEIQRHSQQIQQQQAAQHRQLSAQQAAQHRQVQATHGENYHRQEYMNLMNRPEIMAQTGIQNISPAMLQEVMHQAQSRPVRHIPVRPRRSINERVMRNFENNMFSPEFIPEA